MSLGPYGVATPSSWDLGPSRIASGLVRGDTMERKKKVKLTTGGLFENKRLVFAIQVGLTILQQLFLLELAVTGTVIIISQTSASERVTYQSAAMK